MKTLAKHVKDLRKLWYLEHEQNRKLVEMMHGNSGQSRSRSMRRSVLPFPQDTSSLNLSALSLPPAPKDPLPEALPCLLRLPLKPLRSAFTRLIQVEARPWVGLGRLLRGIQTRSLIKAVKEWALQAGISGIVLKVNVDLRYIRAFDRLDVWLRCKQRNSLKFSFSQLDIRPFPVSQAAICLFSRAVSKPIARFAFRYMQIPVHCSQGGSALARLYLRRVFPLLRAKLRTSERFQAVLARLSVLISHKAELLKSKAFGLIWGLEASRKGLSTAPSLRSSPDKARLPLALYGALWLVGTLVNAALAKNKRFVMDKIIKCRQKPQLQMGKMLQFAVILDRKVKFSQNVAISRILAANNREKANRLFVSLQTVLKNANNIRYSTAWKRLLTHYEVELERKQGLEGFKSVFERVFDRKLMKSAWSMLRLQGKIGAFKAKMMVKCLNTPIARRREEIIGEILRKTAKLTITAAKITVKVLKFAIRRQIKAAFSAFESCFSNRKPVFLAQKRALSRLSALLRKSTALYELRALLQWRFVPCFAPQIPSALWLLTRFLCRRQRTALVSVKSYADRVELESRVVCLGFSVESVLNSQWKTQSEEAFTLLQTFKGHEKTEKGLETALRLIIWGKEVVERRLKTVFLTIKKEWKRGRKDKLKGGKRLSRLISQKYRQFQAVSFTILKERTSLVSPRLGRLFSLLSACFASRLARGLQAIRLYTKPQRNPHTAGVYYLSRTISTPTTRLLAFCLRQIRIYAYNEGRYRAYMSPLLGSSPLLTRSMFASSMSSKRLQEQHRRSPEFGASARPLRTLTTSLL